MVSIHFSRLTSFIFGSISNRFTENTALGVVKFHINGIEPHTPSYRLLFLSTLFWRFSHVGTRGVFSRVNIPSVQVGRLSRHV